MIQVKNGGNIMKKLFISQPMRDRSDEDIQAERNQIMAMHPEYEEVKSFLSIDTQTMKTPALYYLGRSLQLLAEADAVYFADGWQGARGCVIEHECAVQYGVNILHE